MSDMLIGAALTNKRDPKKMAKDEEYEAAVAKGTVSLQMMLADDRKAGQLLKPPQSSMQSTHTSVDELASSGYGITQLTWEYDGIMSRLQPALRALRVDDKMTSAEGRHVLISQEHAVSLAHPQLLVKD
jgi:hypothetical protein